MKLFGTRSWIKTADDKDDLKLSLATLMYFLAQAFNLTIKTALPIPDSIWGVVSAFWGGVILFFIIRAWRPLYRRSRRIVINSYLLFFIVYFLSAALISLRNEPLTVLLNPYLLNVFVFWLPIGLCAASVKNKQILYEVFMKSSYVFVILGIICFLGGKLGAANENASAYNMQLGFTLIIPTLFFLNEVFNGKIGFLFFFLLQMGIILAYANRGVLLSIIFFVAYKVLFERKHLFLSFLTIIASLLLLVFMEPIALYLLEVLDKFNLSSRTLTLLINDSIQQTSGREEIWDICSQMLTEHPVTGYGLGGECYTIYTRLSSRDVFGYGYSPHNGLLQLLLQFGLLGGGLACCLFLFPIFRMHRIKNPYLYYLTLIFGSAVVIPCCYSAGDIFLKPAVAIYLFCFYFDISRPSINKVR